MAFLEEPAEIYSSGGKLCWFWWTISQLLHKSGLYGEVARRNPFFEEKKNMFSASYGLVTVNVWKIVLWSDGTKIKVFG